MTDLRNRIRIFFLTLSISLTLSYPLFAQDAKRDNSPVIKDKEHYMLKAMGYYNSRDLANAKENFLKVLELDPNNDAAYYYLSDISLANQDISTGEILLKKAIDLDSTNYWYQDLLARIYISTKRYEDGIKVYEGVISQFPKKTETYYALANLYIGQENTEKAHGILDKIEAIRGKNESTILTRFNLYRIAKEWDAGLKYLTETSSQITSPRIETIIGDMYAERYLDSLATSHYEKALIMDPSYVPAIYGEAELHRRNSNYAKFFEKIRPVISNQEVDSRMKNEYLGQLLQLPTFVQKNQKQLDTLMDNLANAHPADSAANYLASAYFAQTGNTDKCKELLLRICNNNPQNKNARLQYLSFLYYGDEWETLKQQATLALETMPDNMDILQMLGISNYQLDDMNDAVNAYNQMRDIALRNNDTTALLSSYSMLGDIYHQIGNNKASYDSYKKALKINPNYNPVLNNYAYFLALQNKNLKQAYKMSEKTIKTEPDNPTYLDTFAWILYLLKKPAEAKEHLKHAMLYGGMESAAVLDHYAEILYALKEYDLAFIYWEQAHRKDPSMELDKKIKERKASMKK